MARSFPQTIKTSAHIAVFKNTVKEPEESIQNVWRVARKYLSKKAKPRNENILSALWLAGKNMARLKAFVSSARKNITLLEVMSKQEENTALKDVWLNTEKRFIWEV